MNPSPLKLTPLKLTPPNSQDLLAPSLSAPRRFASLAYISLLLPLVYFLVLLFLTACSGKEETEETRNIGPGGSYTMYANGFEVKQLQNFSLVHVFDPWQRSRNVTFSYLLGEDPGRIPDSLCNLPFITTPVRKVITLSTTHIAMIQALGEPETIMGISGADLVYDSTMIKRVLRGEVIDVGYDRTLNYEKIISLQPDVFFLYGVESRIREISDRLADMDIPVVFCGDYLENHPLGKAEWIRFFSLFYQKEEEATVQFESIDSSYRVLSEMTARLEEKPLVLTGLPWKDTWYMAGGNSFAAKLIEDAGGTFLWNDTESSEAVPLDIESVFSRAIRADVWINPGAARSLEDLVRFDERFRKLEVVRQGRIYNNNARMNPSGGNDYWESGTVRPDLILADLIKVFHPELMEDHQFKYYRKLK